MPTIRNISPLGALDVPLLGRVVDAGEAVEVTDEQAAQLLPQAANWEPVEETEDAPGRRAIPAEPDADQPEPEPQPEDVQDVQPDETPEA